MTASEIFSSSPQLASFLVFIVGAVLRGEGERLKGYTIGVEVLRRDPSFDPQIDPIVRVEATRLRRAIGRYYTGPGADDAVVIDLPRGGYVPRISWRAGKAAPPAEAEPVALSPGNGLPTLRIMPVAVLGTPDTRVVAAEGLASKIAEAFALFGAINIMVGSAASSDDEHADYRLDGTLEYRGNETVDARFKIVDESDRTVIWSRAFEKLSDAGGSGDVERKLILDLATVIVQPYGVISAHDRATRLATIDPRYRCLLDFGEALRSFDPVLHVRVRDRLEQLIAIDPNFALGFTCLAAVYGREYLSGFGARPGDPPALDRALKAARRGIELKPQSARAYHILFTVLYLRSEVEAAAAAADKAMALNSYDLLIVSDYGGRLILSGDVDRGMEIMREAVGFDTIMPSWNHFYLFVGHYMRGELAEARYQAGQLTQETHVFGQLARALMASADGNIAEARRAMAAILALQPEWRDDPRGEIGKLVIAPAIADRLTHDLAAAGFPDAAGLAAD